MSARQFLRELVDTVQFALTAVGCLAMLFLACLAVVWIYAWLFGYHLAFTR